MLLSSTAFSQPGTSPADTPYCMPTWQARQVAIDLLELDSLRTERTLLQVRLDLLEQYRYQATKRATADSNTITQQAQLIYMKDKRLSASTAIQGYYAGRANHFRRQRNVAIITGSVVAATLTAIIFRTGHPP